VYIQLVYAQQEHMKVKLQRITQWHIRQCLTVWKQRCVSSSDMKSSISRAYEWYQQRQTKQGLARLLQRHRVITSSKQLTQYNCSNVKHSYCHYASDRNALHDESLLHRKHQPSLPLLSVECYHGPHSHMFTLSPKQVLYNTTRRGTHY
jgi:hypothetical protein